MKNDERAMEPVLIGDRVKFARDVIVNVIANLIAASIIYLLGALIGIFPSSRVSGALALSILAISTVGLFMACAGTLALWKINLTATSRIFPAFVTIGVASLWAAIYLDSLPAFVTVVAYVIGIAVLLVGLVVTWFSLYEMREAVRHAKEQAARSFRRYEAAYVAQQAQQAAEDARFAEEFPIHDDR